MSVLSIPAISHEREGYIPVTGLIDRIQWGAHLPCMVRSRREMIWTLGKSELDAIMMISVQA